MDAVFAVAGVLGAVPIGAASPGPSFIVVARTAIAFSRPHGLAAALGMGVGGVIYSGLALLGLHIVLAQAGWLYLGLKLCGGFYLIYLAIGLWRSAADPMEATAIAAHHAGGLGKSFSFALATQLGNPKTAIVYAGIFATLLPTEPSGWVFATLPPLVFSVEAGWYAVVAVAFSASRPRAAYLRSKRWIDRSAGVVLGALGLRLIVNARQLG
ncbi:MAG: LysE family transporter [Rhodospirillales bacterium]|nr:LysE family transporter [Rhodospirillales bacterium]